MVAVRGIAGLIAYIGCTIADTLRPPAPVHGWTPARFDYEEQD